jgi:hypothetical protein
MSFENNDLTLQISFREKHISEDDIDRTEVLRKTTCDLQEAWITAIVMQE